MIRKTTPCDYEPFMCPYGAESMSSCEYYCSVGISDEPYPWEDYDVDEEGSEQDV